MASIARAPAAWKSEDIRVVSRSVRVWDKRQQVARGAGPDHVGTFPHANRFACAPLQLTAGPLPALQAKGGWVILGV